jgi:hypothetical protein
MRLRSGKLCLEVNLGKKLMRPHLNMKSWPWWYVHPSYGWKYKTGALLFTLAWAKSEILSHK